MEAFMASLAVIFVVAFFFFWGVSLVVASFSSEVWRVAATQRVLALFAMAWAVTMMHWWL